MARSLLNQNIQVDTVSASLEQIQSFPDVPDFVYESMGPHFRSITISQVAGISFYMKGLILPKGSELIKLKFPPPLR